MDDNKLYELYEKLYFHEIESRESITSRLQLPLAILLSVLSLYALIIQDITLDINNGWVVVFAVSFFISICIYLNSVYHFIGAFYGARYQFMPSAAKLEEYRAKLSAEYKSYDGSDGNPNCNQLVSHYFDKYLLEISIASSSKNSIVNDLRSYKLHLCNSRILWNIIPLIVIFLIYCFGNIKSDNEQQEVSVTITKPIKLEESNVKSNHVQIENNFSPSDQKDLEE